jgi:hypothetical protein
MQVSKLEELSTKLHLLRDRLNTTSLSGEVQLDENNALVKAAYECEFMLPEHLTVSTLTDTVNQKINNVNVLLERARKHEDLPDTAQVAAEQEYTITEEDVAIRQEQDPRNVSSVHR